MKINIVSDGKKLPSIHLPLKVINLKIVREKLGIDDISLIYQALKSYIKENGHFTLVELESGNNYLKIEV